MVRSGYDQFVKRLLMLNNIKGMKIRGLIKIWRMVIENPTNGHVIELKNRNNETGTRLYLSLALRTSVNALANLWSSTLKTSPRFIIPVF